MDKLSFDDIKMIVGFEFPNKSNDIIPKKWICSWSNEEKVCLWPEDDVSCKAKHNTAPEISWPTYRILSPSVMPVIF